MNISGMADWGKYLSDPLVLIGFVFMIIANFLGKNSGKTFKYIFICIGTFIVIMGFVLAYVRENNNKKYQEQTTEGAQSPTVKSEKDITIKYVKEKTIEKGSVSKQQDKSRNTSKESTSDNTLRQPEMIDQRTKGKQSPAVISGGNVNINYDGKTK